MDHIFWACCFSCLLKDHNRWICLSCEYCFSSKTEHVPMIRRSFSKHWLLNLLNYCVSCPKTKQFSHCVSKDRLKVYVSNCIFENYRWQSYCLIVSQKSIQQEPLSYQVSKENDWQSHCLIVSQKLVDVAYNYWTCVLNINCKVKQSDIQVHALRLKILSSSLFKNNPW